MGYLKAVEPRGGGSARYTFPRKMDAGDMGFATRDATATIANVDFGKSPFGGAGGAAPAAAKTWDWTALVKTAGNEDAAKDLLFWACGGGEEMLLVWSNDDGTERVVPATMNGIKWPHDNNARYTVTPTVTWSILDWWRERILANQLVAGYGVTITAGTLAQGGTNSIIGNAGVTTLSANPTNVTLDSSVAGPGGIPTHPDTTLVITVIGPFGGDFGFIITNQGDSVRDFSDAAQYVRFGALRKILAGETCVIDCGEKTILVNGVDITDKRFVDDWQPFWFRVRERVANVIAVTCNGANPTTGGSISFKWRRKYR